MQRFIVVLILTLCVMLLVSCSGKKQEQSSSTQATPTVQGAPPPTATAAPFKKYDVKSGVITFERIMDLGSAKLSNKVVVSFDDYGMKECRDEYADGEIKESFFTDGARTYTTMYAKKTTFRRGEAGRGTEYRIAWEEVPGPEKSSGAAKQVSGLQIAGKDCDGYVIENKKDKTTYAGWGHVCLLLDTRTGNIHVIQKAVKFEENAAVPASKFEPPQGFEVKDSPF